MKNAKYAIAVASVLGLLAIFALPYIEGMKLWELRKIEEVSSQVYIALFGFLGALVISALAVVRGIMGRALGIVTVLLFLLTLAVEAVHDGFKSGTAVGGKILLLAAIVGLVMSVAAAIKPERRLA